MTLTTEDITRVINTYTEYRESLGETQALRATVAELGDESKEYQDGHRDGLQGLVSEECRHHSPGEYWAGFEAGERERA